MSTLKSKLVNELLSLTKGSDIPKIVKEQNYLDYKMFLYTLTINQLIDSIDYELYSRWQYELYAKDLN